MSDDSDDVPYYIPRLFTGASDRYTGEEWRRVYDGFADQLDDGTGTIRCAECGDDVHSCAASADNPGYNEHTGHGYIMFNYEVAICGACLYRALPSIRDAIDDHPVTTRTDD